MQGYSFEISLLKTEIPGLASSMYSFYIHDSNYEEREYVISIILCVLHAPFQLRQ